MSVEGVGARIAAIEAQLATLSAGRPAVAPGFGAAMASAAAPPTPVGAPTATAATAAPGPSSGPGAPTPYAAEIDAAAARHGVDPALLRALIRQESGFDPNARSPAGASGLCQLMPGTAAALGVTDPTDPAQAVEGGAKYLRQMLDRFGGDPAKALAGYNAGPGAVERFGGVPPYAETQDYVRKVTAYAEEYRAQARGAGSALMTAPVVT